MEAIAAGKTTYFNGKPCKHGHLCERRVENRTCAECGRIRNRAHIKANPEANRFRKRRRRKRNPDQVRKEKLKHSEKYRKYYAEKSRQWRDRNKARKLAEVKARKYGKQKRIPPWLDRSLLIPFYEEAKRLTRETGATHHVDHIVPLFGKNVCGLHVPWNLQVITAEENLKKSNRISQSDS